MKRKAIAMTSMEIRASSRCHGVPVFVFAGLLLCFCRLAQPASKADLDAAIASLSAVANVELSQGIEVVNALQVATAQPQSLTVGTVAGRGTAVLPIYFKASTTPVAAFQLDLVLPPGVTVTSVAPGIAAQAAGKSVQGNPVQVGYRVIVFGLNLTAIPSGPAAIFNLNLGSSTGKIPIPITGTSGSSPGGTTISITGKAGSVTVR